jgi:hypothetical protein
VRPRFEGACVRAELYPLPSSGEASKGDCAAQWCSFGASVTMEPIPVMNPSPIRFTHLHASKLIWTSRASSWVVIQKRTLEYQWMIEQVFLHMLYYGLHVQREGIPSDGNVLYTRYTN